MCSIVRGKGVYPDSLDLWIVQQTSDGDYYLPEEAKKIAGGWESPPLNIGGPKSLNGSPQHLLIVLLDKEGSAYQSALKHQDPMPLSLS